MATTKAERALRRRRVYACALRGHSLRTIAEAEDVSHVTIQKDLRIAVAEAAAVDPKVGELRALFGDRLELLWRTAFAEYEKRPGSARLLAACLAVVKEQRRLFGVQAAPKPEPPRELEGFKLQLTMPAGRSAADYPAVDPVALEAAGFVVEPDPVEEAKLIGAGRNGNGGDDPAAAAVPEA